MREPCGKLLFPMTTSKIEVWEETKPTYNYLKSLGYNNNNQKQLRKLGFIMEPPVEPKKEDCCDSGCNPCIFDVYEKQLRLYKLFVECGETSNSVIKENALSQLEYKKFHVIRNIDICEYHRLLLFKQSTVPEKHVFWSPGEHLLVKFQSDKGTCSRAYTPIKLDNLKEDYDFAIIVKMYINGTVSNYLCDLNIGEPSYWRGPYGHYQLDLNKSRLIMIAQGTGISPIFSIIKHILNDEENMTKINLLFCCKSVDTILMREELYSFQSYWNYEYVIYLSNTIYDKKVLKYKEPVLAERLTGNHVLQLKPFTKKDQFLLCGSEEFMVYYSTVLETNIPNVNIVKF